MDFSALIKQQSLIQSYLEKYQTSGNISDLVPLVRSAQFAAIDFRLLLTNKIMNNLDDYQMLESQIDSALTEGYAYDVCNGITTITMPLILPKIKDNQKLSTHFIVEPLNFLLRKRALGADRYDDCTILFEYCYSKNASNLNNKIKDADNLEVTAIINVIDRYLLVSDNHASIAQQTSICDEPDHTKIIILPGKIKTISTIKGVSYNAG